MSHDRDRVLESLTSQRLIEHYGAEGRWFGRWFRSRWCPVTTHGSPAFGVSRDGRWHCWVCDEGGDLLHLIARAEGLSIRSDFGRVLEIAGGICGVPDEDAFGGEAAPFQRPPERPERAAGERLERIRLARLRSAWLWHHLQVEDASARAYLQSRGLPLACLEALGEELRFTPTRILAAQTRGRDDLRKTRGMFLPPSVCLQVCSIEDNEPVDIRSRRLAPGQDEPKIIGMPGGVTWPDGELAGCYGRPASLGMGDVIIVEGWADYLAARLCWPHEDVLGAVDAGQLRVVAGFAAAHCADVGARLVIIAQDDGANGAAGKSIDRASSAAMRAGVAPDDVIILDCRNELGTKDLAEVAPHDGGLDEARDALARRMGEE